MYQLCMSTFTCSSLNLLVDNLDPEKVSKLPPRSPKGFEVYIFEDTDG